MQLLSALFLASAGLAAAVPVSDASLSGHSIFKRECGTEGKWHCDLTKCDGKYAPIGQRATMNALIDMREKEGTFTVQPGSRERIWCHGQVGWFLETSKDLESGLNFDWQDISAMMDAAYHHCNGGAPADEDIPTPAYGYLDESGQKKFSIIAKGNEGDCK